MVRTSLEIDPDDGRRLLRSGSESTTATRSSTVQNCWWVFPVIGVLVFIGSVLAFAASSVGMQPQVHVDDRATGTTSMRIASSTTLPPRGTTTRLTTTTTIHVPEAEPGFLVEMNTSAKIRCGTEKCVAVTQDGKALLIIKDTHESFASALQPLGKEIAGMKQLERMGFRTILLPTTEPLIFELGETSRTYINTFNSGRDADQKIKLDGNKVCGFLAKHMQGQFVKPGSSQGTGGNLRSLVLSALFDFDKGELHSYVKNRFLSEVTLIIGLVERNTVEDLQFFIEHDGYIVINDPKEVIKGQHPRGSSINENVIEDLEAMYDRIEDFSVPTAGDILSILIKDDRHFNEYAQQWSVVQLIGCAQGRVRPRTTSPNAHDALTELYKAICKKSVGAVDNVTTVVCQQDLDFFTWPHTDSTITSVGKDERFVFGYSLPHPDCARVLLFH